ncbi:MAG: rhomboid family intramembrane serine protease [Mizugakiibacter sp.]|uniref:rhomboid family intramembrane serine protease n=1 Tax=Mizugakiibacter sp. TaxID=1972610 RepID=UPI0031BBE6C8|nr:rhomboid family intramembrane serine protease [Xanthomonadaceae bacterium]
MFVHVDSRHRPRLRWATPLLVAACVVGFLWLALAPPEARVGFVVRWGTVPARLFDADAPLWRQLTELPALRLLTALFIHVDWLHLAGNLLFLMIFGLSAERALGSRRFLLLFLLGGVWANLVGALTLVSTRSPIIGCSGAVSAVVGAYLALFPRARLGLVLPLGFYFEFVRVPAALLIGLWVLVQLLFTYIGPSFGAVVWWAHIAGFLFGIAFAWVSREAIARRARR